MILEGNNWYSGHHLKLLLYERYCQENERINHKLKKKLFAKDVHNKYYIPKYSIQRKPKSHQ